jgi:hypothetical protein
MILMFFKKFQKSKEKILPLASLYRIQLEIATADKRCRCLVAALTIQLTRARVGVREGGEER